MGERANSDASNERDLAAELLLPYNGSTEFDSWSVIRSLSAQYPDLRAQILNVNPVWLLAGGLKAYTSGQYRSAVKIPFSMTRTYEPTDSVDLRTGERLRERRHYIGIDAATQFIADGFSVSTADTPPQAMQPQHFHAATDEIVIPLDPIWLTAKNEPDARGQSNLVTPGAYAWIGPNTYHTLVNPTHSYNPHLCLKYPYSVSHMDWESNQPEVGALEFAFGQIDRRGITVSKGERSVRVKAATINDVLEPTAFGTLLFARANDTLLADGSDREDFGSFFFVPPSTEDKPMPTELLSGHRDNFILFQRLS